LDSSGETQKLISFTVLYSRVLLKEHYDYVLIVPFNFRGTVGESLESNKLYLIKNSVNTSAVTHPQLEKTTCAASFVFPCSS